MEATALSYTLRAVARSGRLITEKAIAPVAGINPASEQMEAELGPVLAAVNRTEDAAGRPLLSAVVVGATGLPGSGFFAYARELGLHAGNDDRALWQRELRRVHEYWYRH
jgi:hypothetical protein